MVAGAFDLNGDCVMQLLVKQFSGDDEITEHSTPFEDSPRLDVSSIALFSNLAPTSLKKRLAPALGNCGR